MKDNCKCTSGGISKIILYDMKDVAFNENGEARIKRKYGKYKRIPIIIENPRIQIEE